MRPPCPCGRPIRHAYAQKCGRCIEAEMDGTQEIRVTPEPRKAVIAVGGKITLQRSA